MEDILKLKKGDNIRFEYNHNVYEGIVLKSLKNKVIIEPKTFDNRVVLIDKFGLLYVEEVYREGFVYHEKAGVCREFEKKYITNLQII
jgi:hypothetical protein